MEGGRERDDLPYAEGAAVHMHAYDVRVNAQAPHARHVHLINLPAFALVLCTRGSFVLV